MATKYFNTVEDNETGKPVAAATVKVYVDGAVIDGTGSQVTSGTLATIFSDDGATVIDQASSPLTADSFGYFEFYTNETEVALEISYGGAAKKAISDVSIIGGTVNSDVTALAIRVDNHDTLFGTAANATDLGTFTGTTITDNTDVVTALQELETAVEDGAVSGDIISTGLTMASDRLLGRTTAASGSIEEITAGTGLVFAAGDLSVDPSVIKPTESIVIACSDEISALTTGASKVTFRMPYAFTLSSIRASVNRAPTGAALSIGVNESGTSILSTDLTIDVSEKTSATAATPAVISDPSLADDAEVTIDIDQVGSTIAGAGLKVTLIGART